MCDAMYITQNCCIQSTLKLRRTEQIVTDASAKLMGIYARLGKLTGTYTRPLKLVGICARLLKLVGIYTRLLKLMDV